MWAYIVRRLIYTIPIVIGVLLVTFVLFELVGGDPVAASLGKNVSQEQLQAERARLGLDKPLFFNFEQAREKGWYHVFDSQFFYEHLYKTVTFDFGRTIQTREPIGPKILESAGPSLSLTVPMFLGLLVSSVSLSLLVAFVRGTAMDISIVVLCVLGMSIPMLAIIMFGQYFFAYKLGWFPIYGYANGFEAVQYLLLPVLLGILGGIGTDVRFYRTVMLDEITADYMRTAYAKGLGHGRVMFVHLLKNAMIPVLTNVVLAIPFLFLGSLLLEEFFGIPGLGSLMIDAIRSRELSTISALTYIIAMLFVVGNLLTDISYALVDPRVSLS